MSVMVAPRLDAMTRRRTRGWFGRGRPRLGRRPWNPPACWRRSHERSCRCGSIIWRRP